MEVNQNPNYAVPGSATEKETTRNNIKYATKNYNKIITSATNNLAGKSKPCDIYDTNWVFQEQAKLIDNLENVIKDTDLSISSTNIEKYIDLYTMLIKHNEEQLQILEIKKNAIKNEEKCLDELKVFQNMIEKNMKNADDRQDNSIANIDVHKLNTCTKQKFQEIRRYMRRVIEDYPDPKLEVLIQELTAAYFKGGDQRYLKITDPELLPSIRLLIDSSLIVYHPYDKLQIRMDDFV